jgi:hypothetical protein
VWLPFTGVGLALFLFELQMLKHHIIRLLLNANFIFNVRFEVFRAVTVKNGVLWDVTQCGSCKNRRFGGT